MSVDIAYVRRLTIDSIIADSVHICEGSWISLWSLLFKHK